MALNLPVLRRSPSRKQLERAAIDSAMEAKVVLADYYSALHRYGAGQRGRHWPIERAVAEGYERVIWVFKPVNTIAADHARLPFKLKQGTDIVEDHPLCHVLNKRANPMETGQVFRKRLSAQISLSKPGAFVEKTYSNGGTIKRLDLLPPDRVEIIPGEKGSDVLIECFRLWRRSGGWRDIDPKRVLWFREPHPIDPYSGVTPLEAAGLSVELDYFARLYNVTFMRNDGRPGGVLAVRAAGGSGSTRPSISDREMDRIEERFGKGPHEAGKLSVVEGELDYVDLARNPRDMQYGQVARTSKIELLSAFGVPESVLGYSAERTFDNADNELYVYWTRTMAAHNEIVVSGFDEDSDDDLEGYLDTSGVEVLERHQRAIREEARTEVDAGLRSIKSYADLAGYGDQIDDTPHTRALYIPTGKTPLPSRKDDAKALGLEDSDSEPAPEPPQLPAPAEVPAIGAGPQLEGGVEPPAIAPPPAPAAGPDTAGLPPGYAPAAASGPAAVGAAPALKAIPIGTRPVLRVQRDTVTPVTQTRESALDERARDRLEDTLAAALTALAGRWLSRTTERLKSPKSRKGTRHWVADQSIPDTRGGNKALDAAKAVDDERWSSEAEVGIKPIVEAAAVVAAAAVLADLTGDEDLTIAPAQAVSGVVAAVVRLVADSAARQAMRLARLINEADQEGESFQDILVMVEQQTRELGTWANGVATTVATATLNGSRDAVAEEVGAVTGDRIERTWLSRRDEKVRHSHHEADGQTQPVGKPFLVGESLLRFPCDPLAPVHETANCRCRLLHRSTRTGMFVRPPAELAEAS